MYDMDLKQKTTDLTVTMSQTEKHRQTIDRVEIDIKRINAEKVEMMRYIDDQDKLGERLKLIDYSLGDLDNNMKAADNFMEKYQPIKFLTMMTESLSLVLDKKKLHKLHENIEQ